MKPRDLGVVTEDGSPIIAPGEYTISIGGGQPGTERRLLQASSTLMGRTRFRNNGTTLLSAQIEAAQVPND